MSRGIRRTTIECAPKRLRMELQGTGDLILLVGLLGHGDCNHEEGRRTIRITFSGLTEGTVEWIYKRHSWVDRRTYKVQPMMGNQDQELYLSCDDGSVYCLGYVSYFLRVLAGSDRTHRRHSVTRLLYFDLGLPIVHCWAYFVKFNFFSSSSSLVVVVSPDLSERRSWNCWCPLFANPRSQRDTLSPF